MPAGETGNSHKNYANSPISEAVCELRFVPETPWDLAVPGLVYERLKADFPKRRQVKTIEAALVDGTVRMVQSERLQFLREDEKDLVNVGRDLISVSRLEPYLGWEAFRPLILQAFGAHKSVASPAGFQRIGLRYLNKVYFREERVELSDFFAFYPFVGKQLPQDHGPFFSGIQFACYGGRDTLRLQITNIEPTPGTKMGVLLDLDYALVEANKVGLQELETWLKSLTQGSWKPLKDV